MAEQDKDGDTPPICVTCGVQFPPSSRPPETCKICLDERQFLGKGGQKWTTLVDMRMSGYVNAFRKYEEGLYGIGTFPKFAIGQRALLIVSPEGNLLWDCISFLDAATVDVIKGLGGVRAIAISHPHYYSASVEFSRAFGDAPVHIHERDAQWLGWHDLKAIKLWKGETLELWKGLMLLNIGGHFAGAQVLHWANGGGGNGTLLTGDILQVGQDMKTVSVMRSYPNFIPVSEATIRRIMAKLDGWEYTSVYGAFWDSTIASEGSLKVKRSLERYIKWLNVDDPEV